MNQTIAGGRTSFSPHAAPNSCKEIGVGLPRIHPEPRRGTQSILTG